MRISDWSSDVCSSDLIGRSRRGDEGSSELGEASAVVEPPGLLVADGRNLEDGRHLRQQRRALARQHRHRRKLAAGDQGAGGAVRDGHAVRSEEHTSELQSLMRNSYAVFCWKQKKNNKQKHNNR